MDGSPLAKRGRRAIGQSISAPYSYEKDYRSTLVCHQVMQTTTKAEDCSTAVAQVY